LNGGHTTLKDGQGELISSIRRGHTDRGVSQRCQDPHASLVWCRPVLLMFGVHDEISRDTTEMNEISLPSCWIGEAQPYLCFDVLKTRWTHKRKTYKKDVSLWIGQWSKAIIILLAGSIPKSERNCLAIHHDIGRIIVKNWVGTP